MDLLNLIQTPGAGKSDFFQAGAAVAAPALPGVAPDVGAVPMDQTFGAALVEAIPFGPPGPEPPPIPPDKGSGGEGATPEPIAPTQNPDFSPEPTLAAPAFDFVAAVAETDKVKTEKPALEAVALAGLAELGPILIPTPSEIPAKPAPEIVGKSGSAETGLVSRLEPAIPAEGSSTGSLDFAAKLSHDALQGIEQVGRSTAVSTEPNGGVPVARQQTENRPNSADALLNRTAPGRSDQEHAIRSVQVDVERLDADPAAPMGIQETPPPVIVADAASADEAEPVEAKPASQSGPTLTEANQKSPVAPAAQKDFGEEGKEDDPSQSHRRFAETESLTNVSRTDSVAPPTKAQQAASVQEASKLDWQPKQTDAALRQIADRIETLAIKAASRKVTIQLDPGDFGSITLLVRQRPGAEVEAEIYASHEGVRQALHANQKTLAHGLEQRGIVLQSLSVGGEPFQGSARQERQAQDFVPSRSFAPPAPRLAATPLSLESARAMTRKAAGLDLWI
jgi:hypothetical protein